MTTPPLDYAAMRAQAEAALGYCDFRNNINPFPAATLEIALEKWPETAQNVQALLDEVARLQKAVGDAALISYEVLGHDIKTATENIDYRRENERLQAQITTLREALEKARHGLVTCNNCLATDRPDLVQIPAGLCWTINNSAEIAVIDEALAASAEEWIGGQ